MFRIIVQCLTEVGLCIEIKLIQFFQKQQGLALYEFSHIQCRFLLFVQVQLRVTVDNARPDDMTLPRLFAHFIRS